MIDYATLEQIIAPLAERIHALEVQDPSAGVPGWADFVPAAVSQSVSLGYTLAYARWRVVSGAVDLAVNLTIQSGAGVAGVPLQVTLPLSLPPIRNYALHAIAGAGIAFDANITGMFYPMLVHPRTPNALFFFRTDTPASNLVGVDPAISFINADQVSFFARYEVA
jgi:hypothetical protein